jgi:putative endonuclease
MAYYTYILSSKSRVLYTGVTNNIEARIHQHKNKETQGFTSKYNINHLVYYETFDYIEDAIFREKQIKGWRRKRKIELIETQNPKWIDLAEKWE